MTLRLKIAEVGENNLRRVGRGHVIKNVKFRGMTFVFYFDWLIIRDFYVNLQQLNRTIEI